MVSNWIKLTNGGSGATILSDFSNGVIRKVSKDRITSDRLHNSIQHQSVFETTFSQHQFTTAQVLSYLREGQRFRVDMVRLNGPTFLEYALTSPASDVVRASERFLSGWMSQVFNFEVMPGIEVDLLFAVKLKEIVHRLNTSNNFEIAIACEELFFELLPISHEVNKARFVHGDLTISNLVLVEANRFGILDFTPQNICIIEIDIAKFLQEFLLGWAIRHSSNYLLLALRLRLIGYKIVELLRSYGSYINMDVVAKSFVLNFLRIAPYLHTNSDRDSWLELCPSIRVLYRVISNPDHKLI